LQVFEGLSFEDSSWSFSSEQLLGRPAYLTEKNVFYSENIIIHLEQSA